MNIKSKIASKKFISSELYKLKQAFPQQPYEFFEIVMDRIIYHEFTENDLTEAVNHVIDTFEYKNLTVAEILKKKLDENAKSYYIPDDE